MGEFLTLLGIGVGLMLVIEGLVYAAVPGLAQRVLEAMSALGETQVRVAGIVSMALGVALIWLIRG